MLRSLAPFVVRYRRIVIAIWVVLIGIASLFASRLPEVLKGASDGIPGSRSVSAIESAVDSGIPAGTFFPFLIVLRSERLSVAEPSFRIAAEAVTESLKHVPGGGVARTFWDTGRADLVGEDEHTTVVLFRSNAAALSDAEVLTPEVRAAVERARLPEDISAFVTGTAPMFYDLDRQSSADLLAAERIGLPVTLVILLVAFAAPLAAALPLLLAVAAVALSAAALFLISFLGSVSVFSENVVSMIGLGVGVDYALFVVTSYRANLAKGLDALAAAERAVENAGHTVVVSGLAVAAGFVALFLVNVPFLRSMAMGGIIVVLTAVIASLTLLPALLSYAGAAASWPRGDKPLGVSIHGNLWSAWARTVMEHRWKALLIGVAVLAVFVAPVARLQRWSIGVENLVPELESRRGYDLIERDFSKGAIGPTILLIDTRAGQTVWDREVRDGITRVATRLARDPRVAAVHGFPEIATVAEDLGSPVRSAADIPEPFSSWARDVVSRDDRIAVLAVLPASAPESPDAMGLVDDLRRDAWPEFANLRPRVLVSGASALTKDFDDEIFAGLWVVVPVVLATTFVVLLFAFRSIVVPIKAIVLNLLSVLASYGFLIYVFQDGIGATWLGLSPPGGLNPFIILVLFTVLFGLSMDYEVFLLGGMREAYLATGDNEQAVALGLERTAGPISSAAFVMVSIFGSFGFTHLVPTRELGLGLAFAVALDATLIRLVLVPAVMALMGDANWWPGGNKVPRVPRVPRVPTVPAVVQRPMKPLLTPSRRRPASIDATSLDTEGSISISGRR
jgi:RND superfamily putative drug exporter